MSTIETAGAAASGRAPGNRTAEWKALDTAHHLHPFTDYKALAEAGGSRIVTRADGVWLWDSDGNRILDAMAGGVAVLKKVL